MLLQYFLTSLKPIDLATKPPMSSDDFLCLARDCLSEVVVDDLIRLHKIKTLNHHVQALLISQCTADLALDLPTRVDEDPLTARYLFWWWLSKKSFSRLVRRFSLDAMSLYHQLAHLLAQYKSAPSFMDASELCFLNDIELNNDSHYQVLLAALNDPQPSTLEYAVSRCLVEIIDQHCDWDPFSLDEVFAYFIKLMLCERHASFVHENGQAMLDKIVKGIIHERA